MAARQRIPPLTPPPLHFPRAPYGLFVPEVPHGTSGAPRCFLNGPLIIAFVPPTPEGSRDPARPPFRVTTLGRGSRWRTNPLNRRIVQREVNFRPKGGKR